MLRLIILSLVVSFSVYAAPAKKGEERIIYQYKKYEKFDFEDLVIEGESGSPGDLSVSPRFKRTYKNPLPYRKNFNVEVRHSVERVR
jgi:hypothetical protein